MLSEGREIPSNMYGNASSGQELHVGLINSKIMETFKKSDVIMEWKREKQLEVFFYSFSILVFLLFILTIQIVSTFN
jgi:hypothetical protein